MTISVITAQGFLGDLMPEVNIRLNPLLTSKFGDVQVELVDNVHNDQRQFRIAIPQDTDGSLISKAYELLIITGATEIEAKAAMDAFITAHPTFFFSQIQYAYSFQAPLQPDRAVLAVIFNSNKDDGLLNWAGTGLPTQKNRVLVQTLNDFPTPVGGVIFLDASTLYFIAGDVDIGTNRIEGSNIYLCGDNTNISILRSSVPAAAMITAFDQVNLCGITFTSSGAGSTLFNFGNNSTDTCLIRLCNFSSCVDVGTIQDYAVIILNNCGLINCDEGVTIDGTNGTLAVETFFVRAPVAGATFFTIPATATFTTRIMFSGCSFDTGASSTAINVSNTATIGTDLYQILNCFFTGSGTFTAGFTANDLESFWRFNDGVVNTTPSGIVFEIGNAVNTVIASQGVAVKGVTPGSAIADNRKFDANSTTNRLRYIGTGTIRVKVIIVAMVNSVSGQPKISNFVALNGTTQAESRAQVDTNITPVDPPTTSVWIGDMVNGDFLELFVANDDNTSNLNVTNLNMSVSQI